MATLNEAIGAPQELAAGLQLGTTTISSNQTLTFTLYKRLILPIDGFVFWVNAKNLNKTNSSVYNTTQFNALGMNVKGKKTTPPKLSFKVLGSLHFTQDNFQDEDATYSKQKANFTSTAQVDEFSAIAPDELYITNLPNGTRLAFNGQTGRYLQAGLWHYYGNALFSTQFTQVVESPAEINANLQIVSNSLPLWLQLSTPEVPVFPSYLSLQNTLPPYITADIRSTDALGQVPVYDRFTSQSQLVKDDIKFIFYGLNNDAVMDFQLKLLENSTAFAAPYGIMNMPVPVDEKLTQTEFNTIAQKKSMILVANYYQSRVRGIAREQILQAGISFNNSANVPAPVVPV